MPTKAELMRKLAEAEAQIARQGYCPLVHTPRDSSSVFRNHLDVGAAEQEHIMVAILNQKCRVLRVTTVAIGTLDGVESHPREIFRDAIRMSGFYIIVAHNHPSGDPEPSLEDIRLTNRISDGGKILGIPLLDHVILTANSHCSLAERGLITHAHLSEVA